jgi:hypothetical protein
LNPITERVLADETLHRLVITLVLRYAE